MTVFGPDVSKYQQGLVPPSPSGIGFGLCRATKGVTVDPEVDNVTAWCRTNRVPFCAYHFLVPLAQHDAAAQAAAFHQAVGKDVATPAMLDWETSSEGWTPSFDEALAVVDAIRKLGHKVPLLYTGRWYWDEFGGRPTLAGHGLDLVNANYDNTKTGTPEQIYAARGGDAGPGWNGYGSLTPVVWQFTDRATWGNQTLDFNAYRGDPTELGNWFRIWPQGGDMTLYPYGYSGSMVTMDQLEAKATVRNAHPEFWRRTKAMMQAGAGKIGIGTLWRSSDVQRSVFLQRHNVVASGGCCLYEGRRYQLKSGMAHAAPPGKSFHESTFHGYAAAADIVGDYKWMFANEAAYGLKDFRNVGNEPWHIQFAELPNSVTQWKAAGSPPPTVWKLPDTTPPTPTPPTPTPPTATYPPMGAHDMYLVMKYGGTPDANWSGWYSDGNKRYAISAATGGMDHCARLVRAGAVDAKTGTVVTSPGWAGVTHTTVSTDLTKYLGPA